MADLIGSFKNSGNASPPPLANNNIGKEEPMKQGPKTKLRKKLDHLRIPLSEIMLATDNFSKERLFRDTGGYHLYSAELQHFDAENASFKEGNSKGELPRRHSKVVIKRLYTTGMQDFLTEIQILTTYKHSNIVRMFGFCDELSENIIVYEHYSNGSLDDYLRKPYDMSSSDLTWSQRLRICLDAARGLDFLHTGMEGQTVIHHDVKSANILLDHRWEAKISDFGLSRILPPRNQVDNSLHLTSGYSDQVHHSLHINSCYMDPEYSKTGILEKESDIYSFGVVLFEILCGRLAYDTTYRKESDELGLAAVVRRRFEKGTLMELVDPLLKEEHVENSFRPTIGPNKDSFEQFSKIAYKCIAETRQQRPPMEAIVKELEKALCLQDTRISDSMTLKYLSQEDKDMDPRQYVTKRLEILAAQEAAGKKLYPQCFTVTMAIFEFLDKYRGIETDLYMEYNIEYLAGRVMNKLSSSNLITYDLVGFGGKIPVMAFPKLSYMDEASFFKRHSDLKNGDYIGVIGSPGKSSMGELSIIPKTFVNLSYCLHKIPPMHHNVKKKIGSWTPGSGRYPDAYILNDQETRYRLRFLDLTINSEVKDVYRTRTKVISYVRHFLDNLGFLEVETPTLTVVPGGAASSLFVTYHNDLSMRMYMRNAPELYLKQLVVGGLERVYEIGKQFRNEGTDLMHNPEVTTCEFYMALAGYEDLMELTEQILSGMVKELTGGYKVTYHANGYDDLPIEIDFTPPFRRISMIEELEKMANLSLPEDLTSEEARQYLADACTKFDINCSPPQTTAQLLEKLVGHFLEVTCVNPTFIIDHPEITSPLAKSHEYKAGLTERFILVINELELVNGHSVENDQLKVQCQCFSDQLKDTQSGDKEARALDETFYTALEYGIPPTVGWVLDIDRLTMLLTDSLNIKEVILFPVMKPLPSCEPPIKGEIVPTSFNDNVEDDTPTVGAVTMEEALAASKTLQRFLLQSQNTTPENLNANLRGELKLSLSYLKNSASF